MRKYHSNTSWGQTLRLVTGVYEWGNMVAQWECVHDSLEYESEEPKYDWE